MQTWDLLSVHAPDGTRDPLVLHSDDGARAVLIVLQPGQSLGEHQVKENAWLTVLDGTVEISAGDETITAGRGHDRALRARRASRDPHRRRRARGCLMVLAPWPGVGHYRGGERR